MKSILTILLTLTVIFTFGQFRNTKWDMTEQEVVNVEKIIEYKSENLDLLDPEKKGGKSIVQFLRLDSASLEVNYLFENGRLTGGMYAFNPSFDKGEGSYQKLWEQTKANLIDKYGSDFYMEGDSYNWKLPNLDIKGLYINFQSDEISHRIIYVIYSKPNLKQEDLL